MLLRALGIRLLTTGAARDGAALVVANHVSWVDILAITATSPVVPVAITGARALFENRGNRCTPGTVHIRVLPPIQTKGMGRAEQKQLPDAVRQTILAQP